MKVVVEVGNTLLLKTKDTTVTQDDVSQDIYITTHYVSTDKAILHNIADLIKNEVEYIDAGLLGLIEDTGYTDEASIKELKRRKLKWYTI